MNCKGRPIFKNIDRKRFRLALGKGAAGAIPFVGPVFAEFLGLISQDDTPERVRRIENAIELSSEQQVERIRQIARRPLIATGGQIEIDQILRDDRAKFLDIDVSNRLDGYIFGSFWDEANRHRDQNIAVANDWADKTLLFGGDRFHPFHVSSTRSSFATACQNFLRQLSEASDDDGPIQFVTTNTSLDAVGLMDWFEDPTIRDLMKKTADETGRKGYRNELFRVFILKEPRELCSIKNFFALVGILRENIALGFRVGVISKRAIPSQYSYSYSDFFCVPGEVAGLSISPYYLLSAFSRYEPDDRIVLDHYSNFAEDLISIATNENRSGGFEWFGGSDERLRELMISIS